MKREIFSKNNTYSKNSLGTFKLKFSMCLRHFAGQANLRVHAKSYHDPENSIECDQCGQTVTMKHYLAKHIKQIHQKYEETFKCNICHKYFENSGFYRLHYLTHAHIKPYRCTICGTLFSKRYGMLRHQQKQHPDYIVDPPAPLRLTKLFESLVIYIFQNVNKSSFLLLL